MSGNRNYHKKKKSHSEPPVTKHTLILKGKATSQVVCDVLKDLTMLSRPNNKVLTKKNEILPFEDVLSLEFLSAKNNCSLFALGAHSKKRPHNIVLGRTYEEHILDMYEFGVGADFQSIDDFKGQKKGRGAKPVMVFLGDQWQNDAVYASIQNMLLDFFRGDKADKLSLAGVDHGITCTCIEGKIHVRGYALQFSKSEDSKAPNVVLEPMGPYMDLTLRRHQAPAADTFKEACKRAPGSGPKKLKNISSSFMGDKLGRIHMKKQNLDKMGGKRMSVLRNAKEGGGSKEGKEKGDSTPRSAYKGGKTSMGQKRKGDSAGSDKSLSSKKVKFSS